MTVMNLNKSNATNYQLIFPLMPTETLYETSKEFTLNIFGTIIPSLTLDTQEEEWQGAKKMTDTGNLSFGEWSVEFVVDSEFKNWKILYDWIMAIHNNEDTFGFVKEKGEVIDASLFIMTNYRNKALILRFNDIWPISLGEVSFNKRDSEDDLISNVSFIYDKYEVIT